MKTYELKVKVNNARDWQEAINAISNKTGENWGVRKLSNLYPPSEGEAEQDLILINLPEGGTREQVLEYAKANNLEPTNPREVFAIGEQHPDLDNILGFSYMYVLETTNCAIENNRLACGVWWISSERMAGLYWISESNDQLGWFAFRKSSNSKETNSSLSSDLPQILEINGVRYRRE
jgi:hypothetical protein